MNHTLLRRTLFATVALTTFALPALADLTISVKNADLESTMYLTTDKMAAVSKDGTMVFDAKVQAVSMKSSAGTQTLTKEQLKQMSQMAAGGGDGKAGTSMTDQMAAARQMAVDAIKKQGMSPEQEAQAMAMIDKQFGAAPGSPAATPKTYEKMGKSKKVGEYTAEGYWVKKGDKQVGEVWVASLKEVGIDKKDLAIMGKLRAFFTEGMEGSQLMADQLDSFSMFDPESDSFLGLPLSQTDEKGDVMTVTSITKGKVDEAVFAK